MTAPDADVERVLDRLREYRSQGSVEIPDAALLEIGHMIRAALAAMPRPGSERADALEEAAKIADDWCKKNHWPNGAWGIAAAIRALKDKPLPPPPEKADE